MCLVRVLGPVEGSPTIVRGTRCQRSLECVVNGSQRPLDRLFDLHRFVLGLRKARTIEDEMPEFRQGDSVHRVELEDALYNVVELIREWENACQEVRILDEGSKSLVGGCGRTLPGIATTGEVDEDDTQRPDIVSRRGIVLWPARSLRLTFYLC